MKPRTKLGSGRSPNGMLIELFEHDGQHEIRANGVGLMASRMHHSEEELARLACVNLRPGARVMIGGLGIGFSLRAALDLLPPDGKALQVELMPEVVEWNRELIGHHAGHPLDDPRTELVMEDILLAVQRNKGRLSAIMLDCDNGPTPVVDPSNQRLYTKGGLTALFEALEPGGRLTIWSAEDEPGFPRRLARVGFCETARHRAYARPGNKGSRHWVFAGRKPGRTGPG